MSDRAPNDPSTWRIVLAAVLDFFTVFAVAGYAIARFTGQLTPEGFHLTGVPALVLFGVIAAYFVAARFVGGTLWQRLLRARRGV